MIEVLEGLLEGFDGAQGHVRCFLHVLSLVAKAVIRYFDARPDKDATQEDEEKELAALAEALREAQMLAAKRMQAGEAEDEESDGEGDDDASDEVDAMEDLSEEERKQFEKDVRPVKLALAKVSG